MPLNPRTTTARVSTLAALAMLCVVAAPAAASASEPDNAPSTATPAAEAPPAPVRAAETPPAPVRAAETPPVPIRAAAAPAPDDPCSPGACIDNGTVGLGVNPDGSLLAVGDEPDPVANGNLVGLQHLPTGLDSLRAGVPYEGWGVGDAGSGIGGGTVSGGRDDPTAGIVVESFDVTPTTATSVVTVGDPADPTFRVTHAFAPSLLSPNVYVVRVRIENLTDGTLEDVRYRRVMDWDIEPTPTYELVSIVDGDLAVIETRTDGFNPTNPLLPNFFGGTGDVDDAGPGDLGVTLDLGLGSLASGEFLEFFLYFGAAATEDEALDALGTVGATSWSTARPAVSDDGSPATFFLGYSSAPDVVPDPDPEPEPETPAEETPEEIEAPADLQPAAVVASTSTRTLAADAILPATGTTVDGRTALLGAALLGGGILLLGRGRRRSATA